jgi:hypothetical protein
MVLLVTHIGEGDIVFDTRRKGGIVGDTRWGGSYC